jgi:hypothetical protein
MHTSVWADLSANVMKIQVCNYANLVMWLRLAYFLGENFYGKSKISCQLDKTNRFWFLHQIRSIGTISCLGAHNQECITKVTLAFAPSSTSCIKEEPYYFGVLPFRYFQICQFLISPFSHFANILFCFNPLHQMDHFILEKKSHFFFSLMFDFASAPLL